MSRRHICKSHYQNLVIHDNCRLYSPTTNQQTFYVILVNFINKTTKVLIASKQASMLSWLQAISAVQGDKLQSRIRS